VAAGSSEEKANAAVIWLVGSAGTGGSIVVSGAAVSTVHVRPAGVGSGLPTASVARTSNVWLPSVRFSYVVGDTQATEGAPSRAHANVAPGSDENANVAEPLARVAPSVGPAAIVVSGALTSAVRNDQTSALARALPARSVAPVVTVTV
jgi:hypothetical protein